MESYEVEIRGKTYPVKPVRNICAHNIVQNHIHGGKSIPFIRNKDQTKMEEGEVFAIETFGTTGRGTTRDDVSFPSLLRPQSRPRKIAESNMCLTETQVGTYGYGLNENAPLKVNLPFASAKRLHKTIRENFGTLVWCRRYLDRLGTERYLAGVSDAQTPSCSLALTDTFPAQLPRPARHRRGLRGDGGYQRLVLGAV